MNRAALLLLLLAASTSAHDVITTPITFAREISRLFYTNCAECHRPNGPAFSLLTYDEARPWAKAIKEEVLERRMPPWGAVKGFASFQHDRGLTQEQIELIAEWVEGGAPEGDPSRLPKTPDVPSALPIPAARAILTAGGPLPAPMTLAGIRPKNAAEGASMMVTAERPDGSIEPLLWLYDFHARFARSYWYTAPLRLPAHTKIKIFPAAELELLVR